MYGRAANAAPCDQALMRKTSSSQPASDQLLWLGEFGRIHDAKQGGPLLHSAESRNRFSRLVSAYPTPIE